MRKLNYRVLNAISFILIFLLYACADDFGSDSFDGNYPKGKTMVRVALDFEPFSGAELGTRSAAGNVMNGLDGGLCVLAYDKEGNLMQGFPQEITDQDNSLSIKDVDRTDADASNGHSAESKTKQASFSIELPYGEYYIYAVANLVDKSNLSVVSGNTMSVLNGVMREAIKTRDGFLNYKMRWDPADMTHNREMLGYFTTGDDTEKPFTHKDMNLKTVSVSKAGMTLHSWLRRCASKVTLDFDGSGLLNNVRVYIRKATIHDIASSCALGAVNAVQNAEELISYNDKTNALPDGSTEYYRPTDKADYIEYSEGDDFHSWKYVANGHPYITENKGELHSETATAMYLYENMQGDYSASPDKKIYNKVQESDKDGTGTVVGAGDRAYDKDGVPWGSYIEVEGYYDMSSNKVVEQGQIRYRFMLGKDVEYDFNVERNYHYKVTLCFKGYGNEVDWHIEYTHESGFEVRDPYYVSYLYNHDSTIRFRYTPPTGCTVTSLDAEIVGNNWWPSGNGADAATAQKAKNEQTPFGTGESEEDYEKASFNRNTYTAAEISQIGLIAADKDKLTGRKKFLGNGFLSLRATDTNKKVLSLAEVSINSTNPDSWQSSQNKYMNDTYFYGAKVNTKASQEQGALVDRSKRTYYFNRPDPSNAGREAYTVTEGAKNSLIFNLPMFTRAKNLVKQSAYTGNNPFEAFCRYAYIRLTAHLSDGSEQSQIIRVEQVKRITNPKGIYRSSGNNEPFHVCLTEKLSDNGDTFAPFESDGPWMAEVLGDQNFINLNGRSTISGTSNSRIEFNVRFNRMNTDHKVRNAVIRVRYHNYSCVHLIFVRQGYAPQTVVPGGKAWSTFNLVTKDYLAKDPRDEGSLFKFGNIDTPIDVSSNVYSKVGIAPDKTEFRTSAKVLNIATGYDTYTTGTQWASFIGNNDGFDDSYNIAQMSDFQSLYYSNTGNSPVQQGFGVLYADGATETMMSTTDVYGWCRHDAPAVRDKRGMCGVFIYYWDKENTGVAENYHNIFFPIGRSGFGHRRHWDSYGNGVLRYSCGRSEEFPATLLPYQPLFYDLYKRKGAIYWAAKITKAIDVIGASHANVGGLDLNFFTFDVNLIDVSNLRKNQQWESSTNPAHFDACFLRQVSP